MRVSLKIARLLFNRATLWALILVLIVLLVMIATSDTTPVWIYQGF